jgi:hypothetical protein
MVAACGEVADSRVPGSSPAVTASPTTDPTAGWLDYHSMKGQFSFKHPAGWFLSPEGDSGGLVSIGMGVKHPLGPLDYATDISAASWPASQNIDTTCFQLKNVTNSQPVVVSGVSGSRKTGTLDACRGDHSLELTEYDFTTNGRKYIFTYTARPDAVPLSDFDLMVKTTLGFAA